jgi:hypothetical protein
LPGAAVCCDSVRAGSHESDAAVKAVLNALLLYEDFGTALRARHSLDLLPTSFITEAGWRTNLWRLDLLGEPLLAEQAAIEAAAADVIILSVRGRNEPQAEVRNWLNRWLDHKEDRPYALAVLLDPEPTQRGSDNPVVVYLKRVAEAAHADLFCGFCNVPVLVPDFCAGAITERARDLTVVLEGTPNRAEARL